jgi:U32 family peptidase
VSAPACRPGLCALIRTMPQLQAVLSRPEGAGRPSLVYCELVQPRLLSEAASRARDAGLLVGLATPRILLPGEENLITAIRDASPDVVLVRNIASLALLRQRKPHAALVADHSLNIANDLAAGLLASMGFTRLTPACDLNAKQIGELLDRTPGIDFELVAHQHVPLFHTAYCLAAAHLSHGDDCGSCGHPCVRHDVCLRDRNGCVLPVYTDLGGRSTVFGSSIQWAVDILPGLVRGAVRMLRIEFLDEPAETVEQVLNTYARVLQGQTAGDAAAAGLRRIYPSGASHGTLDSRE